MCFLGIDIGSTTTKAALLSEDGTVLETGLLPTGSDGASAAAHLRSTLGGRAAPIVATGYGRHLVDFADRRITEITCHARGVRHLHPEAACIIDIGGQDSKAIRLQPDGHVEDFAMNDRCAAGTGSFLDMIARKFDLPIRDLGQIQSDRPEPLEISSTCVVFAESEVIGLVAKGHNVEDVIAGVHDAIARRVVNLTKQVSPEAPVYFTGGVARNEALRKAIEHRLALKVTKADHPQFTGAIGAALLGR